MMLGEDAYLWQQVTLLHNLMHRWQACAGRGPQSPLRGQGRVLALLRMKMEISQKEMAYLLDMRGQSLGELLTKLEVRGFVVRRQAPEDRRVMLVSLTPEGHEAAGRLEDMAKGETPFDALDEEEKKQFALLMQKVIEPLRKAGGERHTRGGFGPFAGFGGHNPPPPPPHPDAAFTSDYETEDNSDE